MKNLLIGFLCVVCFLGLIVFSKSCTFIDKSAELALKETDPAVLQKKYEWFKDVKSQLDRKIVDINVYQIKIDNLNKIQNLSRTDKECLLLWHQELAGIISSYNDLAAQYNSNMSKWNWDFTNIGKLPKGAVETLPREYAPYKIN